MYGFRPACVWKSKMLEIKNFNSRDVTTIIDLRKNFLLFKWLRYSIVGAIRDGNE